MEFTTSNADEQKREVELDKVKSLFSFVKELNMLKRPVITDLEKYSWKKYLSDIPRDDENIKISYRDITEEGFIDADKALVSVRKPTFKKCPEPDEELKKWLIPGWDDYKEEALVREYLLVEGLDKIRAEREGQLSVINIDEQTQENRVYFSIDENRVKTYEAWKTKRSAWVDEQKKKAETLSLFTDIYNLYFELQREADTTELIVANGILLDKSDSEINHPVLTKRAVVQFEPETNTVSIWDSQSDSELYTVMFRNISDVNLDTTINKLTLDLKENNYHPLDRNETPDFLKVLLHQLSSDSLFSENGIPESWDRENRLLLYMNPIFIVRKKMDGTVKTIDRILENIEESSYYPSTIRDLVSGGEVEIPQDNDEETVEEQLAAVGGESVDILLAKEANKEQLEIASRIELYNAVLVQGPPGTGKTHTIANLMGHFLAQGKSLLVTSQTSKALSVLKKKLPKGLKSLCVSVLDDSREDMERSVDGIAEMRSSCTAHELKRDKEALAIERDEIIKELAKKRKNIFQIINQECNSIVYNGEDISPSKAADFVLKHADDLSYIPGDIRRGIPLPLSLEELDKLYASNAFISDNDEEELEKGLPNPVYLIEPNKLSQTIEEIEVYYEKNDLIKIGHNWIIALQRDDKILEMNLGGAGFKISLPDQEQIECLAQLCSTFDNIDSWMKYAAIDGRNGGAQKNRWDTLISQIELTCQYSEKVTESLFGKKISFSGEFEDSEWVRILNETKSFIEEKGKISKISRALNKDLSTVFNSIKINESPVDTIEECEIALNFIQLKIERNKCAAYWDDLLTCHGAPDFFTLDTSLPEYMARKYVPIISKCLEWYEKNYSPLCRLLDEMGIPTAEIFETNQLDTDLAATEKILTAVYEKIPDLCEAFKNLSAVSARETAIEESLKMLSEGKRLQSEICQKLSISLRQRDVNNYTEHYAALAQLYAKTEALSNRKELLEKLSRYAQEWSRAIADREGIHGKNVAPASVEDAWRWKQYSYIIDEITSQSLSDAQAEALKLSKEYRKITAEYAEKCAWYELFARTEGNLDIQQALMGWKQTVSKIGAGKGKNAPRLRARAQELMGECQKAVPAWIMPIGKALETLNPKENRFDIVIIDEASQSDISSLAILYMGKKLVIVGDDKQVSPMAVGVDIDKENALVDMYIKDKIPNYQLFNSKTSLYDLAATVFQPLMLREHFRCVPDIIGFSNMLSYDYKIKPLRESGSSQLLPALISYRVSDGFRDGSRKINDKEARTITAIMRACIERPEYKGKTMGVISMLGDDQVKLIQKYIAEDIDGREVQDRKILCGNSANFQGDERDIIFLSLVDSGSAEGPLRDRTGTDDTKKRYNVAVSRARDQLWVVHSLDYVNDLKPGDLRRRLLEYVNDPKAFEQKRQEIEEKADSPFEVEVIRHLTDAGYHIEQQWSVGAYRIDMVAISGSNMIAIECDGERFHSGEAKIREDMERQTILERLGWRFIRIRGSEYYRNPEKTMERVFGELEGYSIFPESAGQTEDKKDADCFGMDCLGMIKLRVSELLGESIGLGESGL